MHDQPHARVRQSIERSEQSEDWDAVAAAASRREPFGHGMNADLGQILVRDRAAAARPSCKDFIAPARDGGLSNV